MKKLLLILTTVFVSVMGWAVDPNTDWNHPNPYAYDLKSEVIDDGATLKLTYSLNANAVNDRGYNDQLGVQIYLIDKNGERIKKADGNVYACTSGPITKGTHSVTIPVADLPLAAKDWLTSWEVVVHGNENRTEMKAVYNSIQSDNNIGNNNVYKPRAAHGIAIGQSPSDPFFGKLFTTEASYNKINNVWVPASLYEYNMQMKYQKYHAKDKRWLYDTQTWENSYFSQTPNYEPHRVVISDDGRMFVTCYHTTAKDAVLEYLGDGKFRTIIQCGDGWYKYTNADNERYYRRAIDMDVYGSGPNLKMIVAWITPKYNQKNSQWQAMIEVREYTLGENNLNIAPNTGNVVAQFNDMQTAATKAGLLYQGVANKDSNGKEKTETYTTTAGGTNTVPNYWNSARHGFVGVRYGEDGNSIWMKIDPAAGYEQNMESKILYFDNTGTDAQKKAAKYTYTAPNNTTYRDGNGYYGGNAIFIKGDTLITGSGANTLLLYTGVKSKSLTYKKSISSGTEGTGRWINDFDVDYAGNLYALSEDKDNVVIFAMPYDGTRTTRASASQSFNVSDPIPNILATDLRFAPVPKQPKYRFSFNVNTKPAVAQIRFYKSYGDGGENDMKKNLAKINADDYQGGNAITPSFVYNIPEGFLKQGEIAVEFDMVGGIVENGVLNKAALPRGEWYWSVYVEAPRKSTVFAPIYKQGSTGEDTHYRLHATVNNYPETDGFGHIYAAQYYNPTGGTAKKSLMVYNFNPTGYCNDEQGDILSSTRYKLVNEFVNPSGEKTKFENQRRLTVAPDGKVYIADHGLTNQTQYQNKNWAERPMVFTNGGIYVWDPKSQEGNEIQLQQFLNNKTETSSGVAIWYHGDKLKLYGMNTYGEFGFHTGGTNPNNALKWKNHEYSPDNQDDIDIYGWNGFKEYALGTLDNILLNETNETIQRSLGKGDAGGNTSIVAMEKGIWICQHRENDVQYTIDQFLKDRTKTQALPDNTENYLLSFVPYDSNNRTWTSCTTKGINYSNKDAQNKYQNYDFNEASDLTQKTSSPVQSAPGAGMTYRKINGVDYIFMVKHTGDIAQLKVTWSGNTPTVTYVRDYPSVGTKNVVPGTARPTGTITSMCFDFAGNLITTAGMTYFDHGQDLIVYTMPYDRVNAREIQAPNSCRFIPERTAYLEPRTEMELTLQQYIEEGNSKPCYLDIFRPMPNTSFSTICLPFDLDMKQLTTEALKDAEVKQYKGLQLSDIGGEKMLELVFEDVPTENGQQILEANTPYIIQPKVRIPGIIQLQEPIQFVAINEQSIEKKTQDNYAITFKGLIPTEQIDVKYANGQPLTLLLVAENRLAEMVPDEGTTGMIYGFRGYFELNKPLNGIGARITPKQSVSTSTTIIVDGKRVNINKYLREGRVYIRVGDTLYTVDGQLVK